MSERQICWCLYPVLYKSPEHSDPKSQKAGENMKVLFHSSGTRFLRVSDIAVDEYDVKHWKNEMAELTWWTIQY